MPVMSAGTPAFPICELFSSKKKNPKPFTQDDAVAAVTDGRFLSLASSLALRTPLETWIVSAVLLPNNSFSRASSLDQGSARKFRRALLASPDALQALMQRSAHSRPDNLCARLEIVAALVFCQADEEEDDGRDAESSQNFFYVAKVAPLSPGDGTGDGTLGHSSSSSSPLSEKSREAIKPFRQKIRDYLEINPAELLGLLEAATHSTNQVVDHFTFLYEEQAVSPKQNKGVRASCALSLQLSRGIRQALEKGKVCPRGLFSTLLAKHALDILLDELLSTPSRHTTLLATATLGLIASKAAQIPLRERECLLRRMAGKIELNEPRQKAVSYGDLDWEAISQWDKTGFHFECYQFFLQCGERPRVMNESSQPKQEEP